MQLPYVEKDCTFAHEGNAFTAGGAIVSEDRIICYCCKDSQHITDWHGNEIGTYRVISSRPAIFFGYRSWMGDKYYYMRAKVNGYEYSIRGFGPGMIATGKRIKSH